VRCKVKEVSKSPMFKLLGRTQRGIAMTEFVIILPLALMLVMSVAEFGQAFMQYNTLTKAIRDGARHAAGNALQGSTGTIAIDEDLLRETRNLVVYGNRQGSGTPVLPNFDPEQVTVEEAALLSVSVAASYAYAPIFSRLPMFAFGTNVNPNFTFEATIVMRAL
jgi:hypothetical protein